MEKFDFGDIPDDLFALPVDDLLSEYLDDLSAFQLKEGQGATSCEKGTVKLLSN